MSQTRKLTPVSFTRVMLEDSFWAPRIETNRLSTIPAEYRMCEDTGRINVLDLKWTPGDPNPPHIFWGSDIAKWIEAASYTLAVVPDAQLSALLDQVIKKIAHAQQPDGYFNTYYTLVEPQNRWTNLRDNHELYCAGHMIEAAVAHYQATGKRQLLDVVCRFADYIDSTFGTASGKKRGYCGHEEIELALVKLYHATGVTRYLDLARYFVDERGRQPHYYDQEAIARGEDPASFWAHTYAYMQAHIPVREQTEVVGHAVRAMYLYSAMADLANETGDTTLLTTCEHLWEDLCLRRMYITGGIGPSASNEGFTTAYDLPDETAYAETCAAVGLVFWNHRMLQFQGDGKYADIMEKALYNGTISGISLDGRTFFYVNPLASAGNHHRKGWFDCACCPPNIARLIASVGGYFYSEGETDIWVHLYAQGNGRLQLGDAMVGIRQTTTYPWSGSVTLKIDPPVSMPFGLHLRIPGWCGRFKVALNGTPVQEPDVTNGYMHLYRTWSAGDMVHLELDMPVEYVQANPNVKQMLGRVALQRGPLVYCLEGVDHAHLPLDHIILRGDASARSIFHVSHEHDLLGGVSVLTGVGTVVSDLGWDSELYRFKPEPAHEVALTAIPYYAWDNRAPGEMRVWLRTS